MVTTTNAPVFTKETLDAVKSAVSLALSSARSGKASQTQVLDAFAQKNGFKCYRALLASVSPEAPNVPEFEPFSLVFPCSDETISSLKFSITPEVLRKVLASPKELLPFSFGVGEGYQDGSESVCPSLIVHPDGILGAKGEAYSKHFSSVLPCFGEVASSMLLEMANGTLSFESAATVGVFLDSAGRALYVCGDWDLSQLFEAEDEAGEKLVDLYCELVCA